jgi:hypothetical protein
MFIIDMKRSGSTNRVANRAVTSCQRRNIRASGPSARPPWNRGTTAPIRAGLLVAFRKHIALLRIVGGETHPSTEILHALGERGLHAVRIDAHVGDGLGELELTESMDRATAVSTDSEIRARISIFAAFCAAAASTDNVS